MSSVGTEAHVERAAPPSPRRDRALRWAFAAALVAGTLLGVVVTTALALVLAAPRIMSSGLQPMPEHAALRWLVSPEVSGVVTQLLLGLLAAATLLLAALVVAHASGRTVWRAWVAWAVVGTLLATYALLANWSLAREAGVLAFVVGALWSLGVGLAVRWLARRGARAFLFAARASSGR